MCAYVPWHQVSVRLLQMDAIDRHPDLLSNDLGEDSAPAATNLLATGVGGNRAIILHDYHAAAGVAITLITCAASHIDARRHTQPADLRSSPLLLAMDGIPV